MWRVELGRESRKFLAKAPPDLYGRLKRTLVDLSENPRPQGCLKLQGASNAWRIRLHALFCQLTGQEGFSLRFGRDRLWYDWIHYGWGEDELRLVCRYLRRQIADGKRNPGALKFSNLIGKPDSFEEDLLEARRVLGARKPKPKYVHTTQPLPGGGERQVVVPRDCAEDAVDVSAAFSAMRKALNSDDDQP